MGSQDLLVMAMALPPMCLAATLWWSMRHAVDELRDFRPLSPGRVEPEAPTPGAAGR